MKVWVKYRDKDGNVLKDLIEREFFEGIEFEINAEENHYIHAGIGWRDKLSLSSPIGTRLLVLPSNQNWLYLLVDRE